MPETQEQEKKKKRRNRRPRFVLYQDMLGGTGSTLNFGGETKRRRLQARRTRMVWLSLIGVCLALWGILNEMLF